jgi:UMF1 family MFS transporter
MQPKNNPKTIRAWAFFDWANSAYNLVITSTIFPAYYVAVTANEQNNNHVTFFGKSFVNTALQDYVLAAAYLVIAILLPILTSIADYRGNKRIFMQFFTWVGAISCGMLYFFEVNDKTNTLQSSMIFFGLAAIGYCGGFVFYNSYLPEIATLDKQDDVSAKGFTYGYIGSVILQLICFAFVLEPKFFGIVDKSFPARLSFLLTGIWWIGFAYIPFSTLPKGSPNAQGHHKNIFKGGFIELGKVWQQVKQMPVLKRYLPAFFFYSMGVQTIMLVATGFGAKELKLAQSKLIATILIIQLVAIAGATLMSRLSDKFGNVRILASVVAIWIGVCIGAYFTTNEYEFYVLAAIVGLVMGGIQSLSRSTYSKLIPQDITDSASFFSFYDVTEKLAIVGGMFSFGLVDDITNNMRNSTLVLCSYFVVGLVLLLLLLKYQNTNQTTYA